MGESLHTFELIEEKRETFLKVLMNGLRKEVYIGSHVGDVVRALESDLKLNNSAYVGENANRKGTDINKAVAKGKFTDRGLRAFIIYFLYDNDNKVIDNRVLDLKTLFDCIKRVEKDFNQKKLKSFNNFIQRIFSSSIYIKRYNSIELSNDWKLQLVESRDSLTSEIFESQSIKVEGTITVDNNFIASLECKKFSVSEFYTGVQVKNCQWLGIINKYDVIRDEFNDIYDKLLNCFARPHTLKVASIIYGVGGVGKSTLLRRLAYNLATSSTLSILWLQKGQFTKFQDSGLEQIKQHDDDNFLFFIEDWYQIYDVSHNTFKTFFLETETINNLRIVIGDRDITNKIYLDHLYNPAHLFELDSRQNKRIIKDIVAKFPKWSSISHSLFKKPGNYDTPLFVLLFILAYSDTTHDLNKAPEAQTIFQKTVAANFRHIFKSYPSLAKALFYLSCIYLDHRKIVSYDWFLKIADHLDSDNQSPSQVFFNLNGSSEIHRRLRMFIHTESRGKKAKQDVQFVLFNHDLLSDIGVSQLPKQVKGLGSFDDIVKRNILDLVINTRGNDYSASSLLRYLLMCEPSIFKDKDEIKEKINLLIKKGNFHSQHINALLDLDLSQEEFKNYFKRFYKLNNPPIRFITEYFKKFPDEIKVTLSKKNIQNVDVRVVKSALVSLEHNTDRVFYALKILSHSNVKKIDPHLLKFMFYQIRAKSIKRKTSMLILRKSDFFQLSPKIVCSLIKDYGQHYEEQTNRAALRLLKSGMILTQDQYITILGSIGDKRVFERASKTVLFTKNIVHLVPHVVARLLKEIKDEEFKQEWIIGIVESYPILNLSSVLICSILDNISNDDYRQMIVSLILEDNSINDIYLLSKSMRYSNDIIIRLKWADRFLKHWQKEPWGIVYRSMFCYAESGIHTDPLKIIIKKIIYDFNIEKEKKHLTFTRYANLMKIPFHSVTEWKDENERIIENWRDLDRTLVYSIILSNKNDYSNYLLDICNDILNNWRSESQHEVQFYVRANVYGAHVEKSLANPELREKASVVANQIIQNVDYSNNDIPENVIQTAQKICDDDLFPNW